MVPIGAVRSAVCHFTILQRANQPFFETDGKNGDGIYAIDWEFVRNWFARNTSIADNMGTQILKRLSVLVGPSLREFIFPPMRSAGLVGSLVYFIRVATGRDEQRKEWNLIAERTPKEF